MNYDFSREPCCFTSSPRDSETKKAAPQGAARYSLDLLLNQTFIELFFYFHQHIDSHIL